MLPRQRQPPLDRGAAGAGVDDDLIAELADALAHAGDADAHEGGGAGPAARDLPQTTALVADDQGDACGAPCDADAGAAAARVAVDVGQALLDDAKQGRLDLFGQTAGPW